MKFEQMGASIMAVPLAYPGLIERDRNEVLITYSRNHSLNAWVSWTIFLSDMPFFVRRIQWIRRLVSNEKSGCGRIIDGVYGAISMPYMALAFGWIAGRRDTERFDAWLADAARVVAAYLPTSG